MLRPVLLTLAMILTMSHGQFGFAQSSSSAEATLHDVISESAMEEAKAKELEEKTAAEKDRLERRMRQVQQEISQKRYEIEGFKMRQEKAKQEMLNLSVGTEDLNAKLETIKREHAEFSQSTEETLKNLGSLKQEFSEKQKDLETRVVELSKARKRSERNMINQSLEVQAMKADIARIEATKAELESKMAEMEADEMKVRNEWMQTKLATAESQKQKDDANARLNEAKVRRDMALKDLQISQAELAKAQKDRNDSVKKAEVDVAKYEKDIANAHRERIAAESEQIRLDAEVAKIREYVARMKENQEDAAEQASNSQGLVLRSTLNLETARTELARSVSAGDKVNFERQKEQAKARGMAEAAQAADIVSTIAGMRADATASKRAVASAKSEPASAPVQAAGRRTWITSGRCSAYEKPNLQAKSVGYLGQGEKFSAMPAKKPGWVRIYGAGGLIYVEGKCGDYANE